MEYNHVYKKVATEEVQPYKTQVYEYDLDTLVPLNLVRKYRYYHIVNGCLTVGLYKNFPMSFILTHGKSIINKDAPQNDESMMYKGNGDQVVTIPLDPHILYRERDTESVAEKLRLEFGITVHVDPPFWIKLDLIYCHTEIPLSDLFRRRPIRPIPPEDDGAVIDVKSLF